MDTIIAMTGDELWVYLQTINWPWLGVLVAGGVAIFKGDAIWSLIRSHLPSPAPAVVPVTPDPAGRVLLEDATALQLVQTLRVVTCLEPPTIREGIAVHLDDVDRLLGGNPEDPTDLDTEAGA